MLIKEGARNLKILKVTIINQNTILKMFTRNIDCCIEMIQVYKVAGAAFLATLKNHTAYIDFPGIFYRFFWLMIVNYNFKSCAHSFELDSPTHSLFVALCPSLYLYVSLPLSFCLSSCVSVYLSVSFSLCLTQSLSLCLSQCLSLCIIFLLSLLLCFCLYFSICLSLS